ncbi:ornithine racemase Orr [Clostridiaceae bacterium M8S5]|nr:ornithine racemase Orr [Clostridiaceae bacterium M8S5]
MSYPCIEMDLNKIKHNTKVLIDMCNKNNVDIAAVTKVFCANKEVVEAIVSCGIKYLADSRINNLKQLQHIDLKKILLRLPMQSRVNEIVKYADISLNSEIETVKLLSKAALELGKIHGVILMLDLGDLREGLFNEEKVDEFVNNIKKLDGVKLIGIGTNLTCYGGVIPKYDNLSKLSYYKKKIEDMIGYDLEIISGGNSSNIYLLQEGNMPSDINMLRLGEALALGRETAFGNQIENMYDDCFIMKAELIELQEKPSVPIGEIGMDAFGNKPEFEDKGIIKRAICAIGRQDISLEDIIPLDKDISIIGGSGDHLLLDVTKCKDYKVGDVISFKLTYTGILRSSTSEYVDKVLI